MTAPVGDDLTWLDDLERAHAAATKGPWSVAPGGGIDAGDYDTVIDRGPVDCMAHCYGGTSTIEGDNLAADAAAIVALHNAFPALIAELRKRDAALRRVLSLMDFADGTGRAVFGISDGGAVWVRDLRAALTAPLAGQRTTGEEAAAQARSDDSDTADELAAAGLRACCGQPSERHCQ